MTDERLMGEFSTSTRIAELEADNRRLRLLLDQRDTPSELRHRLRSAMALLRSIIRRSTGRKRTLDEYVGHLEDRFDALVRAQAAADEHGCVDLHKLLADEFLHYAALEDDRVTLSGPIVELSPRAGQVFALAAHELAANAVEHGALGTGAGRIDVTWSVSEVPRSILTFIWKEVGGGKPAASSHEGFGTEVLTQMLQYEFEAETELHFQPDGLRCAIRFPLLSRIGRKE